MRNVGLMLALVSVLGCSSPDKRTLVVYSPHGKEMLAEYERKFEQATPGVDVQWLDMGSKDVADALCGVVYGLTMRREIWGLHNVSPFEIPSYLREQSIKADARMKEAATVTEIPLIGVA